MPTVPTYNDGVQAVGLNPAFRQGITVEANPVMASPEAFGSSIGRGMQQAAQGMDEAAQSLAAVQQLDDVNAAKDADNRLAEWQRNAMYGDGGFMTLEGRNAVQGRAEFEKALETKRMEFGKGLTPGAAQHYAQASQARTSSVLQQSIVHSANERKSWFTDTSNMRIETFAADALAGYTSPAVVNKNLAGGIQELRQQAQMHGWDADALAAREAKFVSGISKNIVLQLAQNDPLAAEKYIDDAGRRLLPDDAMQLRNSLKAPVLAAKANRNAAAILGGLPAQEYGEDQGGDREDDGVDDGEGDGFVYEQGPLLPGGMRVENGNVMWGGVGTVRKRVPLSAMIGANEHDNAGTISAFIKAATGISINPKTTPWCAAFVNAVLGTQGIEGTGSLAARSFMNFGTATDNPKVGDIVVFGRGNDSSKGHVGFFQGYDANGNILVLGGNQGRNGSVSVSAQNPANLLGFRTAGTVDENVMKLPIYSPQGLGAIDDQLSKITDPDERAATQKVLSSYYAAQKKVIDANRQQAQSWAETQVMQDPSFDVHKMPLDVQTAIGAAGMTTLLNYQEKVRTGGQPVTDDHVLYDLQTQFATDPDAFSKADLFQYRDKLSNADWDKVTGWRQTALTDSRKAKEESTDINAAFSQAGEQLKAVGLVKIPSKMTDDDNKRVAQFQNTLADQVDEFKRVNGKRPTQSETQALINKLLLPIVIKTPGSWWDSKQDAFLFEAGTRADGTTVETNVPYEQIPIDMRIRIADDLERLNGRKPTAAEVSKRYADFVIGQ